MRKNQTVHWAEVQETSRIMENLDGKLYQLVIISEWGNHEGLGSPMNVWREWWPVPVGDVPQGDMK